MVWISIWIAMAKVVYKYRSKFCNADMYFIHFSTVYIFSHFSEYPVSKLYLINTIRSASCTVNYNKTLQLNSLTNVVIFLKWALCWVCNHYWFLHSCDSGREDFGPSWTILRYIYNIEYPHVAYRTRIIKLEPVFCGSPVPVSFTGLDI
jgi:hypothetical protein